MISRNSPSAPEVRVLWAEAHPLTHLVMCHLNQAWYTLSSSFNNQLGAGNTCPTVSCFFPSILLLEI